MDPIGCIRTRMSIRGFRRDEVPKEILEKVVETARWSPSYKNTQPWEVVILSGKKKEELSERLVELLDKNEPPCPDIPEPQGWPEVHQSRIKNLYEMRAKKTGINLSDPEVIRKAKKANFRFYGAPHAVYLYQDASLPLWSLFDMGLFAQSFMLAAHALGLATVPQAFATDYARYVKEFLGIPATKRLVLGLSLGYPDEESPANAFRPDRAGLEEILRFVE